jgi:hypothetical protein
MLRLPRVVPAIALACATAMPLISTTPVVAQEAPGVARAANPLRADVENFWHYAKIGKYDLATDAANKLLNANPDQVKLLETFEQIAEEQKDKIDVWMLRWQGVDKMKDTTAKLLGVLDEARKTRRADPNWIEKNIQGLGGGARSYALSVERLRDSGELAVPQMIDYLRNPDKAALHDKIYSAIKDLGQLSLNPLVAATEMQDGPTLLKVIRLLQDLKYRSTVPYLAKLAQSNQAAPTKTAATAALQSMGAGNAIGTSAGDQFYDLSEEFYYDKSSIRNDTRNTEANVWTWYEDKGLQRVKVPHAVFNPIMAMRSAKTAMKLNATKDAVSMWLVSNYQREVKLADGKDPTMPEGTPSAHFFGVSAGTQYLNAALARALGDYDAPVALKVVKSLQEIVGRTNLLAGPKGEAITDAMRFSDRQVRIEAAMTVAQALPTQQFPAKERVVPLLAEAVHQTGQAGVLVMFPGAQVNGKVDELNGAGYKAIGGQTADELIAKSANLPAADVIIVTDEMPAEQITQLFQMANGIPRLERAAKIVISKTITASPDRTVTHTPASDAAGLKPVIDAARAKVGGTPMDDKLALGYALRAADLLTKLAINNNQVLDVSQAQQSLVAALEDSRPDVVKAVANVLALIKDRGVQQALVIKASDDKASDEVKIALFKALATNAKNHGNLLEPEALALVQKAVTSATNLDVRSAAAEARGALNLPVEQAKTLITEMK